MGQRASPRGAPEEKGWQREETDDTNPGEVSDLQEGAIALCGLQPQEDSAMVPRSPEGPELPPEEDLSAFTSSASHLPAGLTLSVPGRGISRCPAASSHRSQREKVCEESDRSRMDEWKK